MFVVLEDVLSFVFLPARVICSLTLGRLISFAVLPAQSFYESDEQLDDIEINTDVLSEEHVVSDKNQYVIYFGGNGESGSKFHGGVYDGAFYLNDENINTHLIKFDMPGVFRSPGAPNKYTDLVDASEKVVDKLLAKGIKPEQIVLHGLSLGGSISLYTYKRMLDRNITLGGVFNDRSFSTLSDAALGMIGVNAYDSGIIPQLFYFTLKPIVKAILWLCMWEMDPYSIYQEIDDERKDFIAVENNDLYRDGVIHHGASMYSAINNASEQDESGHLFYAHNYFFARQHMFTFLDRNHNPEAQIQTNQNYFHEFQRRVHGLKA